jgi:hypothetical protein
MGSCRISRSGRATGVNVVPVCRSCPPGLPPVFFRSDRFQAAACPALRSTAAWRSSAAPASAGLAAMDNPVVHFEILGSDGIKLIDFYRGVFEYDKAMRKVVGPRITANVNT